MNMESISERLFDADVRIEKLFFTAALCACPSSEFKEFVEDELKDEEELLRALPPVIRNMDSAEDILTELSVRRSHGFFIQLATPVPRSISADGIYTSSWGHCRLKWLFLMNLGDVAFAAEKFRDEVMDQAKKQAAV